MASLSCRWSGPVDTKPFRSEDAFCSRQVLRLIRYNLPLTSSSARAELGMTDRTGGPDSSHYTHRLRPENYEEEDEVGSDGEDASSLKARRDDPGRPNADEEEIRLEAQDLTLARSLRLRAEGLEKVVTSMLEQPPPVHPTHEEDFSSPPTSPNLNPPASRVMHPHTLPNGVRLRLALGTMINDLFARQAPTLPHQQQQADSEKPFTPPTYPTGTSYLPLSLSALLNISASSSVQTTQPWTSSRSAGATQAYAGQGFSNVICSHISPIVFCDNLLYSGSTQAATSAQAPHLCTVLSRCRS